jgi:hypothetical protein
LPLLSTAFDIQGFFSTKLPTSSADRIDLLARLFYAIASPNAVVQLREAFSIARKGDLHIFQNYDSNFGALMEALDNLDATSTVARILRRYYLVKLLDFRRKREDHHKATQQRRRPRKLCKYNLEKIDMLKQNGSVSTSTAIDTPTDRIRTTKGIRADSQAIEDLLATIHPEFASQDFTCRQRSARYLKIASKLKSRFNCGRNWYRFSQRFSPGILALIPSGREHHIATDQ